MTGFVEAVPRRRVTACAVYFNAENEILIVKPTYRSDEGWLIPGGSLEQDETPFQACAREVCEELGFALPVKQLLCVEYQSEYQTSQGARGGDIHFVFHGGVLSDSEISQIRPPADEIADCRFCGRAEALRLLCPRLRKRLVSALAALDQRRVVYVENEVEVGNWEQKVPSDEGSLTPLRRG
jgi:8-oxo-dGTP pyrophosphatase MutT (NUDIX family)